MSLSVNSNDVAKKAGVSRTTVSYVLNGRHMTGISEATRERVLRAAEELGYRVPTQRPPAGGKTNVIKLLALHVYPMFFARNIDALIIELNDTPYEVQFVETGKWSASHWVKAVTSERNADGIVVLAETENLPMLLSANSTHIPIVSVGASYVTYTDHVGVNYYAGAGTAVRHMLDTGCRNIAFLTSLWHVATSRYQAYAAQIGLEGMTPQVISFEQGPEEISDRAPAYRAVNEYLSATSPDERVDGLFCFNDEAAIAALRAIREHGLRVPEDIAIVTCDDVEEAAYQNPPLTALRYPFAEVMQHAWAMLQRRADNPDMSIQSVILTPELIIRGSTRQPPAA